MCRDLGAAKLVAASAWHVGSPVCRVALRSRSLLHECDVTVSRPAVRSATPEGSELGLLLSCVLPEFGQLVRRIVNELKHFESEEGVSVGGEAYWGRFARGRGDGARGGGGRVSCWEEGAGCRLMESRLPISPLPPVAAAEAEYTEQQRG